MCYKQISQNITKDYDINQLAYITYEELYSSMCDNTLLAIRAPPDTNLDMYIPEVDKVTLHVGTFALQILSIKCYITFYKFMLFTEAKKSYSS